MHREVTGRGEGFSSWLKSPQGPGVRRGAMVGTGALLLAEMPPEWPSVPAFLELSPHRRGCVETGRAAWSEPLATVPSSTSSLRLPYRLDVLSRHPRHMERSVPRGVVWALSPAVILSCATLGIWVGSQAIHIGRCSRWLWCRSPCHQFIPPGPLDTDL